MSDMHYQIAVLVPCYNEEATIGQVVADFRAALPSAVIYVYDNNSTDRTADVACATGAVVRHESLQGKGNVVRRMFADVDADIYVLVDGDGTYDAASAPGLVKLLALQRHFNALTKFAHVESRFCGRKRRGKAALDVPINPCVRSVCSRSVAVGLR